jgi:hypothetical protein
LQTTAADALVTAIMPATNTAAVSAGLMKLRMEILLLELSITVKVPPQFQTYQ